MISIKQLTASYGDHQVLKGVNLELSDGMIHGLAGLNGSGKTTLLHALCGIKKVSSGHLLMHGERLKNSQVAMVETEPYFYKGITGSEYLELFRPEVEQNFATQEWLDLFAVPGEELTDTYSTGMKKKLALIGACKLNRPVLLLDEPYNGLDLESSRVLTAVLRRMASKGTTIVITSHILQTLTGLCTYIHYLKNGVIEKTFDTPDPELIDKAIFRELDAGIDKIIDNLL